MRAFTTAIDINAVTEVPYTPPSMVAQLDPSQAAMRLAAVEPAAVKLPATKSWLPCWTNRSTFPPLTPPPTGHQRLPSQRARLLASGAPITYRQQASFEFNDVAFLQGYEVTNSFFLAI